MNPNSQVLLSVGIPTIAVLVGILVNNRQIDALRAHLDDKIDTRFNALQEMMNARFAVAHEALRRVEGVLDARLSRLEEERGR
ncbi:MAG TPA: hypothetical protein VK604_18905 [Bryobacteraceae bacterium]|nr:hypothetical protein [Bryobacteraceae bacterium]